MILPHLGRTASACASIVVLAVFAGCATPPGPNEVATSSPTTDHADPAPASTTDASAETKPAPSPSNPAAARYILPGMTTPGAVGSIVVLNPVAPRTLDLTERPDDIWDRVRTGFGIPNIDTPLVAEQQAWYLAHPDYLRRAVDRSSLYLYHVVEELNKRGMPTELALLPFVESAYNPMAYSRAHASGMWQFIPGTGRDYNLKQDWWRDERRDVIASTDAALTYLQTIYEMHGDWHLALASYNWGEGSVKRAIERNQAAGLPTDYLSLNMPDETRNYVPKLQALKNIIANPQAFGVTLPRIGNQPYFVAIPRDRDIDVRTAARLANMTIEDFRALNPSFNRPVIVGTSGAALLVPADREQAFKSGLASQGQLATWQAHTVKRKETIERIAAQYGMTAAAVREVNGLSARSRVRPGQALLVQKKGDGDVELRFASFTPPTDLGLISSNGPTSYQVRRGDSIASIARRFGMKPAELASMNRLRANKVTVGEHLHVRAAPAEPAPHLLRVKTTVPRAASATKKATPARVAPASKTAITKSRTTTKHATTR